MGAGWQERPAAPSAAQWVSKHFSGEQTFQDQVNLLPLRGETVHPNFSISGKTSQYWVSNIYQSPFCAGQGGINKTQFWVSIL